MVGIGVMPMILGVTLVRVRPFVIVVGEIYAMEAHFAIRVPAITAPVAGSVSENRRCTEKYSAPKG